jgi:hypothetical protein
MTLTELACSLALVAAGCGSPPAAAPSSQHGEPAPAVDGTGPAAPAVAAAAPANSAWPAALVPCAKDAPAGEGCAATAPKTQAGAGDGAGAAGSDHPVHAVHPVEETIWKVPVAARRMRS